MRENNPTTNADWCVTCEQSCQDHANVCTICGEELHVRPTTTTTTTTATTTTVTNNTIASSWLGDDVWERPSEEAMDPTMAAASSFQKPTSQKTLQELARIHLQNKDSTFFYNVSIQIQTNANSSNKNSNNPIVLDNVTMAEFGPFPKLSSFIPIVPAPHSLTSGRPSQQQSQQQSQQEYKNTIWLMERGGGITFVQKALAAQEAGASGVICYNNIHSPWPYTMKDSTKEAIQYNLKIPIVMIPKSDGKRLLSSLQQQQQQQQQQPASSVQVSITCQRKTDFDCIICCEPYGVGQTVIQLPICSHVFHESCALKWLTKHNNCPYCRKELPTDENKESIYNRPITTTASNRTNTHDSWNSIFG